MVHPETLAAIARTYHMDLEREAASAWAVGGPVAPGRLRTAAGRWLIRTGARVAGSSDGING